MFWVFRKHLFLVMQQNDGELFWCSVLVVKKISMADNTLAAAPTGEDAIATILEDTTIATEKKRIVIFALGFSQGDRESATNMTAFNFYNMDHPKCAEGKITNNKGGEESTTTTTSVNFDDTDHP